MKTLVIPVIMCGGSGTRLWPLSRAGFPKQFLVLSGNFEKKTLFQEAVERLNQIGSKSSNVTANLTVTLGRTLIATNEDHRF
jgi:mannose-1-phosphate guanylyltransferase/mannose-6-phosphate isomerase